jgi:glycosyltransferase involved in cell wall biosynthesis
MRVLMAHNAYQQRGGEDESTAMETALLRAHGNEVQSFEADNREIDSGSAALTGVRAVWNLAEARRMTRTIKAFRPDVVHVQNFFPLLSPAIHHAAYACGVPVVQSLRNYRLLCVNGLFFRNGRPCERCLASSVPYPGIRHACYRKSRLASAAVAAMITAHRSLRTWERRVAMFIALSEFAREKFVEAGFPSERITVKPNFVYPDPGVGSGRGGYALFVGRLSAEKGLRTLLEAWTAYAPALPLKIVGDGPEIGVVDAHVRAHSNIEHLGRLPLSEVYQLMANATLLVFPSEWYETFGRVAIEAFAHGTPVVAANIGAIRELVDEGRTGALFQPGNAASLAEAVARVLRGLESGERARARAREVFEARYTADENYAALVRIYDAARTRDLAMRALGGQPRVSLAGD